MQASRRSALLIGVLAVASVCDRALAQDVTLPCVDDTWVREDNPTSNRNGNLQMNARTDSDGDDNDVILLRFDTSSLAEAVSGATLQLTWFRSDSTSSRSLFLYGLNETHPDETTWDEAVVVYNDAPGLIPDGMDPTAEVANGNTDDDIQDLDTANLTLLIGPVGYGPQEEGENYTFSGAGLDAFINADTNGEVTFLILRDIATSGNQARFITKENTSSDTGVITGPEGFAAPLLIIRAPTGVPALGGWGLVLLTLALAGVGASLLRKRSRRAWRAA